MTDAKKRKKNETKIEITSSATVQKELEWKMICKLRNAAHYIIHNYCSRKFSPIFLRAI